MAVNSHDIRMREFRRAILRGYSAADVDTFLMHLAVEMDRLERSQVSAASPPSPVGTDSADAPAHARDASDAPQEAGSSAQEPQVDVDGISAQAREAATQLVQEAGEDARAIVAEARANAERGLRRARQRAEELLREAHEQQDRASRAEAEAQLRLAHVNKRLADEAERLAQEASRLDALAGWVAEQTLAPEASPESESSEPERSADVLPLQRAGHESPLEAWGRSRSAAGPEQA